MAHSRDRLVRQVDLVEVFAQRRTGSLGIYTDEARRMLGVTGEERQVPEAVTANVGAGWLRVGSPRNRRSQATPFRRNAGRGRGRVPGSVLPAWYPRTPLRDITAVVRAIERRRARLGEVEGQQTESPLPQEPHHHRAADPTVPQLSGAQLEHELSTPGPSARKKKPSPPSVLKVQKFLHDISKQSAGDPDNLTPQKKLLESIDTVEQVVKDELRKLKRTPSAKRAEREKKMRTLMSMR